MLLLGCGLLAVSAALTVPTVAVVQRPLRSTSRASQIGRCPRLLMLSPDGSDTTAASPSNDAARASRLTMNAADAAPSADDQLQAMLDAPLFDPWSTTPEFSLNTPGGCVPGPLMLPRPHLCCPAGLHPALALTLHVHLSQVSSASSRWCERTTTWQRPCGQCSALERDALVLPPWPPRADHLRS